jgi:hypothetical protein
MARPSRDMVAAQVLTANHQGRKQTAMGERGNDPH